MKLLNLAIEIAGRCKDKKEWYLACVAKRADGAIVYSVNHSVVNQKIPEHHAEARVLRKCDFGSVLYVARVFKDRITVANSAPCNFCQNFIKNMGVKKVYFTIGQNSHGVWWPTNSL
jgi:tRNA(Arg) A34 adenosine deaminase TadA